MDWLLILTIGGYGVVAVDHYPVRSERECWERAEIILERYPAPRWTAIIDCVNIGAIATSRSWTERTNSSVPGRSSDNAFRRAVRSFSTRMSSASRRRPSAVASSATTPNSA